MPFNRRYQDPPSSTRRIQDILTATRNAMCMIERMPKVTEATANGALEHLRKCITDLQRACDNPDPTVPQQMVHDTRVFTRRAIEKGRQHTTRLLGAKQGFPAGWPKKPRNTNKAIQRVTSYTISTKVIDLTGDTSEEDSTRPAVKSDMTTFDPSLADLVAPSCGPTVVPQQAVSTRSRTATTARIIQDMDTVDGEARGRSRALITEEATPNIRALITPPIAPDDTTSPLRTSATGVLAGFGNNDTNIPGNLQGLVTEQEDLGFLKDEPHLMREVIRAAMNRRDHELWYDPSLDFEEDLLP